MHKAPTTLIIMDGFGLTGPGPGNAVSLAQTPQLDRLFAEYAHTTLSASGLDVGLPAGQMGNSEVGHTNIGGGRVVFQDLPRISRAIDDGSFFENAAYNKAMDDCLEKGSSLHLYGLLSDGGVHSHIQHLYALLQMAKNKGLTRVYVHAFLDGRDVSPTSGRDFVSACRDKCQALGVGKIATVMGRYYAMDRDNRWERVQLAYDAMVYGEGIQNPDPVDAVAQSYANDVTDEFMEPVVCDPEGTISDNDSIIFFNFRPDRAREITRAIVDPDFDGFQREYFPTTYVCNTEYDASMPNVLVAWPRIPVKNGLGEYLSSMGLTQLRIAETEKYAHVTFFFNGGVEKQYPGEDRVLVPSPKVATYDLQPEMSAREVCDKCVERINSGAYDVIILNFANCDMVGHTGVLQAAVKAVETVDECVGRVVEATLKMGGIAMVTADHGNAEVMLQPDGSPMTAHTTNLVPFILCGAGTQLRPGRLADIAPTILDVMGLAAPQEMDGQTLIVKEIIVKITHSRPVAGSVLFWCLVCIGGTPPTIYPAGRGLTPGSAMQTGSPGRPGYRHRLQRNYSSAPRRKDSPPAGRPSFPGLPAAPPRCPPASGTTAAPRRNPRSPAPACSSGRTGPDNTGCRPPRRRHTARWKSCPRSDRRRDSRRRPSAETPAAHCRRYTADSPHRSLRTRRSASR